ncbi:cobyrinate a,c-diamide synthase, partial [Oceanospirillaceae bacterium]|nr:cobyrinate a,c-diamide synthase [Oceanospirillaceae bacterium]
RQRHPAPGEAIYRQQGLTASYLHLFFPSNPQAVAQLFTKPLQTTHSSAAIGSI